MWKKKKKIRDVEARSRTKCGRCCCWLTQPCFQPPPYSDFTVEAGHVKYTYYQLPLLDTVLVRRHPERFFVFSDTFSVAFFFLLSSYIECKHDAWSCNSHPVIIRKRPRELRRYQSKPWCCRTTEPKSTAAYPEPCENKEISPEGNKHLLFKSFFTQLFCYILT